MIDAEVHMYVCPNLHLDIRSLDSVADAKLDVLVNSIPHDGFGFLYQVSYAKTCSFSNPLTSLGVWMCGLVYGSMSSKARAAATKC
jgi:hypothetical protein